MAVYVDDMEAVFGSMIMCHMIADTDEELHEMADKIGVKRKWHQSPNSHYDICRSKKRLAIKHGAIQITLRQCALMSRNRRLTGVLGPPPEAT